MVEFKIGDEVELIEETIPKLTDKDWIGIGRKNFNQIKICEKLFVTDLNAGIKINNMYYYPKKCFRLKEINKNYELW